jgi:nanoRNase/pAp phosphatase (c-di-AMP/oligoRNAs hydrolase)
MGLPREWWLSSGGINVAMLPDTLTLGQLWRKKHSETVTKICGAGVLTLVDPAGRQWAAFPDSHHHVSDVAEALRQRGVDVTCGFFQRVIDGRLCTVLSLRSAASGDNPLDVGALCKTFGGGGHTRAAGCKVYSSDSLDALRRVMEVAS